MKRHRTAAEWKTMAAKAQRQIESARAAGTLPAPEHQDHES